MLEEERAGELASIASTGIASLSSISTRVPAPKWEETLAG